MRGGAGIMDGPAGVWRCDDAIGCFLFSINSQRSTVFLYSLTHCGYRECHCLVLEQIPWRFLPSRVLGWSTTTTMVRVTRYKEWNFICRRCLEPMVFEDWPIGI